MKLVNIGAQIVTRGTGKKYQSIFETPNGTRVVRMHGGYYPVNCGGYVRTNRRYIGMVNGYEAWESMSKMRTVTLVEVVA